MSEPICNCFTLVEPIAAKYRF